MATPVCFIQISRQRAFADICAHRNSPRWQNRRAHAARAVPQDGPENARKIILGASIATMTAAAILLASPVPADAISGGKESVGIFKPLDDQDLSGKDLRRVQFTKGSLRRVKFDEADLSGTTLFGAFCKDCSFRNTNLRNTNLESADLEGADFSGAVLEGAMVTNARFRDNDLDGSDWTDVLLRKDQLKILCAKATGTNPSTGVDTRESLNCP
eukprot:jgi/Ulvmu1/9734/UM055_0074.1